MSVHILVDCSAQACQWSDRMRISLYSAAGDYTDFQTSTANIQWIRVTALWSTVKCRFVWFLPVL